jgi:hypothetical protein
MTQLPIGPTSYAPAGVVHFDRYRADGGVAVLVRGEDGEPYYTASVCIPGTPPADGCFWCKNYSENQGVADALFKAGIAVWTGREVQTGYAVAEEMRLTTEPRAHVQVYKWHIGDPERFEFRWETYYCEDCGLEYYKDDPCAQH